MAELSCITMRTGDAVRHPTAYRYSGSAVLYAVYFRELRAPLGTPRGRPRSEMAGLLSTTHRVGSGALAQERWCTVPLSNLQSQPNPGRAM